MRLPSTDRLRTSIQDANQEAAELAPELLDSLARKSQRMTPPVGVEPYADPPVVQPPRAMWPIFVGIAAGVLGIAAFLLVHYLL